MIRQGDLIVRRVADAEPGAAAPVTLAVGEESGHSHVVEAVLRRAVDVTSPDSVGVVDVLAPTELRIEGQPWRHDPIPLAPGRYEYWVQRELSDDDEVSSVAD